MLSTVTNCGVRAPANSSSRFARHHLQVAQTLREAGTLYIGEFFFEVVVNDVGGDHKYLRRVVREILSAAAVWERFCAYL